jgi:hypothetical protein
LLFKRLVFRSSVNNRGTNFAETRFIFKSSVNIRWHELQDKQFISEISSMIRRWSALIALRTFSRFSSFRHVESRPDMQCTHNITCGTLHNVYTSLAVVTTWYHFTETERDYGALMLPATMQCTSVCIYSVRYFCLISIKFQLSQQVSIAVRNIKFHKKLSSASRGDTCGLTAWYHFNWKEQFCVDLISPAEYNILRSSCEMYSFNLVMQY